MKLFDAKDLRAARALAGLMTASAYVNAEQAFDVAVGLRALLYAGRSVDQ